MTYSEPSHGNIMALLIHNIWEWICHQLNSDESFIGEKISFSTLMVF
ncbi:hypothetical protein DDB_G0267782 [Dictyostelium discoideum AX4]|uniref:Uncharacterized protein n=1 Tax=Dictyostelium discoideum TaxID=44689 RepID=Q55G77_DICDI|nr:hypothetical protein DDB_G0267782 [Dictyostelium discoideum AX4]EAL73344.1 hypothetical protein DDB_G0267782 [Dictyostelium discoideum AX4]|eukprot:XP_647306.1 hypothetical protein DDB_G0267782 [Dictyostelium discoideum AX4]